MKKRKNLLKTLMCFIMILVAFESVAFADSSTLRVAKLVSHSGTVTVYSSYHDRTYNAIDGMSICSGDYVDVKRGGSVYIYLGCKNNTDIFTTVTGPATVRGTDLQAKYNNTSVSWLYPLIRSKYEIKVPTIAIGRRG